MGLEETMAYPTVWLYILGSVNASRENTHIRANVLEIFVKTERGHTILTIIGEIISLIVGLWLLSWAWEYTRYSWRVWRESPTLYIPTFYSDVALVVGMTLMMIYTAAHLVRHIRVLQSGELA
jgi:TRAP-type C4-dicarboxylate transport system permease small subunit